MKDNPEIYLQVIDYISFLGRQNRSTQIEEEFCLTLKPLPLLAIKSVITHSHLKKSLKLELERRQHTVNISVNMFTLVMAENVAYLHQRKPIVECISFLHKAVYRQLRSQGLSSYRPLRRARRDPRPRGR